MRVARLKRMNIKLARLPFPHRAKTTMTRADIPAKHEGCSAIRPALKNVRATSLLTYRVQIQAFNQLQDLILIGRVAESDAQPLGFGLAHLLVVTDYS